MRLGIKPACDTNENADDDRESAHDDVVAHVVLEVLCITNKRSAQLETAQRHPVGVLGTKVALAHLCHSHIPMPFCVHSTPAICSGGAGEVCVCVEVLCEWCGVRGAARCGDAPKQAESVRGTGKDL